MEFRNIEFACVWIFLSFLDSCVNAKGQNDTVIIKYRSYKGTILSTCAYVSSDVTSTIECSRLFSESINCSAFLYDQNDTCMFCEIQDVEFNATGHFFMREPNVVYPRQNETIWIPGGMRVGQLIEVQTKVHFDRRSECGLCIVFYNGTADKIGNAIPLALQVHFDFTHVHGYTFINGSLRYNIKNITRPLLAFDRDFTTSILVTAKAFKISIEGQFYLTYNHIITALETIQYICLNCITYNKCDYGILREMELRIPKE